VSTFWALWALPVVLAAFVAYLGRSALEAPASSASAPLATPPPVASSPPPASIQPAPPAEPAPAAALADPVPAPAEELPSETLLTLRGAPAGARVQLGDEVLGDASKPVRVPFGKRPLELTVSAPGYEPFALSVVPDRDAEHEVKLKRRAARPKPKGVPSDLENPF
jgi:hypothetical protein